MSAPPWPPPGGVRYQQSFLAAHIAGQFLHTSDVLAIGTLRRRFQTSPRVNEVVHLHGFFFQVLDRDGVPEPHVTWKDTVRIDGHSTIQLAVRLDAPGHWMFHCQIPEHAEGGMMGDLHVASPSPVFGEPGPCDSTEGLP